ncbi:UNKNOWN [Stylonychia lemnae]|uniref:Uncharacterized protein n=1 Tax=Stylonychia lemnae TaxID=5949 RepID=A0A078APM6_STYLE|nr:UNKNOWN [Stylonychia lemnae]|eukprot:CDW84330.1 UNKNOWN [Stylonychia lemnae]
MEGGDLNTTNQQNQELNSPENLLRQIPQYQPQILQQQQQLQDNALNPEQYQLQAQNYSQAYQTNMAPNQNYTTSLNQYQTNQSAGQQLQQQQQQQQQLQQDEHLSDFSDFSDNSDEEEDNNRLNPGDIQQNQQQSLLRKRKRRESADNNNIDQDRDRLSGENEENKDDQSRDQEGLNKDSHHPTEYDDDGVDLDLFEGGLKTAKFIMKNGCCRECMKAFSKTGKVYYQLFNIYLVMFVLSSKTLKKSNFTCKRIRDKRQEIKNKLKKEGKYYSKRQRLLDSDDEELQLGNEYDEWNKSRKEFCNIIQNITHLNMYLLGVGVPMRQPSYILGRPPEFVAKTQGGEPVQQDRRGRRESDS